MIKPLLVNDLESIGGAAKAAQRLHRGLLANGIDSKYLVSEKVSDDESVLGPQNTLGRAVARFKLRSYMDRLPLLFYSKRREAPFSVALFPNFAVRRINQVDADIIHLHWVAGGMLRVEDLAKLNQPLLWTFHDSWPFTGGCHVPYECKAYMDGCMECPILQSNRIIDLSSKVFKRKKVCWQALNITIVTPSRWLADCSKSSFLFRDKPIHVIPNGLDTRCFKPVNKKFCRRVLNLPLTKTLILFGSSNPMQDKNKGFDQLTEALHYFLDEFDGYDVEFVIFGASKPLDHPTMGVPVHYMGSFQDELSLALLYAAADVMVVPSKQESFGQTASEAMACGCPVVAFATTGLLDIIDHQKNGFLASPFDTKELAFAINWVLEDYERHQRLSNCAREKAVQKFDFKIVARQYFELYRSILTP